MKVLLTGAKGMLAGAFLKMAPQNWNLLPVDIDDLDITDVDSVEKIVSSFKPEFIINCAAFTQVDVCEEKKDHAFLVNGAGPGYLAQAARNAEAFMIHFSTDYVFDGFSKAPYLEEDPIHPVNVYGESKWEGECQIRKQIGQHLILRTQWLYGDGGNHFVKTVLRLADKNPVLKMVHDQVGSPTWTEDLCRATLALLEKNAVGTFHLANRGYCSWFTFASKIVQEAGLSVDLVPCSSEDFPRAARRPAYSVLSTEKAEKILGESLPSWEAGLKQFISETQEC